MQDQFDAVIYLGPQATFDDWALPKEKCANPAYIDMRLGRMAMFPELRADADRLRNRCKLERHDKI